MGAHLSIVLSRNLKIIILLSSFTDGSTGGDLFEVPLEAAEVACGGSDTTPTRISLVPSGVNAASTIRVGPVRAVEMTEPERSQK
jgi:hypothetical protein